MRVELDILLAALSLYLFPDIYLEDLPWEMEMGKGWGLYSNCFTGWGRTSNNLICYLFIEEPKEDSFCHLKSRALWITKLTKTLGFFMPFPNNEGDTTLSGRLRIRAVLN